jgi:predicted site-specific integrase-resolvase
MAELATAASVTPATARRWAAEGSLRASRAGARGRWRVRLGDAAEFLDVTEDEIEAQLTRQTRALVRSVEAELR